LPSRSKQKGDRGERDFVSKSREAGLDAERIPLSGAAKGSYEGDVKVEGVVGECKVRADGFKTLYRLLEHDEATEFLALKADRKDWLIVLPMAEWLKLMRSKSERF